MDIEDDTATAKRKALDNLAAGYDVAAVNASAPPPAPKRPRPTPDEEESKRHARLESNRKAARESRRRKKVLVEELQRSIVFFTRTNVQLRQNNEFLEGLLVSARIKLGTSAPLPPAVTTAPTDRDPPVAISPQTTAAAPTTTTTIATSPAPDAIAVPTPPAPRGDALPFPPPPPPPSLPSPADVFLLQQQQQQQQITQNALMANWLAMAQQFNAASGLSGLVPNPMLAIPGLFGNGGTGGIGVGIVNNLPVATGNGVQPASGGGGGAVMQQATKFVPGGMSSSRNPHDSLGQRTMIQQHQHRRQQKREMGIGVPLAGAAGGGGTAALT